MYELIPKWLEQSISLKSPRNNFARKNSSSYIPKHLVGTGHSDDPILTIKVLLRNPIPKPLALGEAMLLWLHNPILRLQKLLTQSVQLPWY